MKFTVFYEGLHDDVERKEFLIEEYDSKNKKYKGMPKVYSELAKMMIKSQIVSVCVKAIIIDP
jgi:hypothetical protein